MDEQQKKTAFSLLGILVVLTLLSGGALLPLIILLGVGYVVVQAIRRSKEPYIINTNGIPSMNTFDLNGLLVRLRRAGSLFVIALVVVVLLINMIVVIPAGSTGVYHLFGKVRDKEVSSGIHLINPLAQIERMSIRTEQYTMSITPSEGERLGDDSIEALTKEGLKVNLDITVLYHLIEDRASDVYREIGIEYPEKIIRPEVRSSIRQVIATYEAKDIYSDKREEAVNRIKEVLTSTIQQRGIAVESVLLRNVSLPAMLTGAIENKLTAEQEAQRYDFVLQRETKEAERKRVEAEGQRDAQRIINESLTGQYLQYLYIQNLENREGTIYVPYDLPLFRGL